MIETIITNIDPGWKEEEKTRPLHLHPEENETKVLKKNPRHLCSVNKNTNYFIVNVSTVF